VAEGIEERDKTKEERGEMKEKRCWRKPVFPLLSHLFLLNTKKATPG
jgi:hypothetical protein